MSVRGGRERGGVHPLKNGLTAGTKSLSVWNPPPRRGFWVDSIVFAALYIVRLWPRLKRLGLSCAFSVFVVFQKPAICRWLKRIGYILICLFMPSINDITYSRILLLMLNDIIFNFCRQPRTTHNNILFFYVMLPWAVP